MFTNILDNLYSAYHHPEALQNVMFCRNLARSMDDFISLNDFCNNYTTKGDLIWGIKSKLNDYYRCLTNKHYRDNSFEIPYAKWDNWDKEVCKHILEEISVHSLKLFYHMTLNQRQNRQRDFYCFTLSEWFDEITGRIKVEWNNADLLTAWLKHNAVMLKEEKEAIKA
jgi:hypothetical protein